MDSKIFDATTAKPLHFNKNGKFRILHITDTHVADDNEEMTLRLIGFACDREKPDVVVITGDNFSAKDAQKLKERSDRFMNVFQDRNIPVALTFGNHDSEAGIMTRQELMALANSFPCSISVDEGDVMDGCGTYTVPILSSTGDDMKFNLWIFDSGDYDDEGHYANVSEEKVEWYRQKSDEITRRAGKKVYSLAFQHIIVPEIYSALKRVKFLTPYTYKRIYHENEYYRFDPKGINYGLYREPPCCGYYNHGQFDAFVEKGDVLAVFSGHDHTNAFGVKHMGVDIVNSLSSRYQDESFSTQYGYRVIDIDENKTDEYKTRVVHWFDIFKVSTFRKYKNSDELLYKIASSVAFHGMKERFIQTSGHIIVGLCGRKVKYKD